jgi:hypothetical protein
MGAMAAKDRFEAKPFTCANRRFRTHIEIGQPHGNGQAGGSVFPDPLVDNGGYTLWLEHVTEVGDEDGGLFWFMWYDQSGSPTIPASGVLNLDQIKEMTNRLIRPP